MPDTGYMALLVGVSAAVTWALRALPFAVLAPMRDSAVVRYLSVHMPVGVMAMLALYSVKTVVGDTALQLLWLVMAVAVTAGLQLWRGRALLSILVGTACYVTLMTVWGG
ncbi:branched-chain amino acid ABC transporter [Mycolicibacterium obuense]|uniref:Branched-chain amino acid ABC transporter n=1 Tax=Mycolicibacterium obuense TaxID=1807 RepID=A0A0J6W7V0_9MYCO|nr:AzlD domain-containing protein [Mycolicibacterium obuense]KKE98384.1 branched-chain amino acid ABC transporter [Mycolicibacterium obuense]KMO77933.1 Branched-chain amino acid transport protein (AzlD) [Mycolicibacterium obuense]OKH76529.1 branched-chain amino acid ABC transporter [Mycobacterium sp. SWH-M1]TDL08458.1 branched-chain amino acid ABC transporter [Mycolicibacterium obuense]